MLLCAMIALDESDLKDKISKLLVRKDTIVEPVKNLNAFWWEVPRNTSDLLIVDRELLTDRNLQEIQRLHESENASAIVVLERASERFLETVVLQPWDSGRSLQVFPRSVWAAWHDETVHYRVNAKTSNLRHIFLTKHVSELWLCLSFLSCLDFLNYLFPLHLYSAVDLFLISFKYGIGQMIPQNRKRQS